MLTRDFNQLLGSQWRAGKFACTGLDSNDEEISPEIRRLMMGESALNRARYVTRFNVEIVEATADITGMYKPNAAFYEAMGSQGWEALRATVQHIHQVAPHIPVILDAKRADIGSTNKGYVGMIDWLGVDAITVHPYLGSEALKPFLDRADKGIIVLCRTSNPGAAELQNQKIIIESDDEEDFFKGCGCTESNWVEGGYRWVYLYQHVAWLVAKKWNTNSNCCVVVGATYPKEMAEIREISPNMPFLIPGVGKQGGSATEAVKNGRNGFHKGMIINNSRAILFASKTADFATAAREQLVKLDQEIRLALTAA